MYRSLNTNTSFSGEQNHVYNHFILFSLVTLAFSTEHSAVITTTKRISLIGKISWACKAFQVIWLKYWSAVTPTKTDKRFTSLFLVWRKYSWINDWHWNRSGAENILYNTGGFQSCILGKRFMLGIVFEWICPLDSGYLWVSEMHQFLISPRVFF